MLESKWRNFRIELNQYYFSCKSRDYYSHDGANEGNFVTVQVQVMGPQKGALLRALDFERFPIKRRRRRSFSRVEHRSFCVAFNQERRLLQ